MKNRTISYSLFLILTACGRNIPSENKKASDTIHTANGYDVIIKNNRLEKIFSVSKNDTSKIDFNQNEFIVTNYNKESLKEYFFDNENALYKIKYGDFLETTGFKQNQIIHLDTTANIFLIQGSSSNIFIENLQDTIRYSEKVVVKFHVSDSIFDLFKLNILDHNQILSYDNKKITRQTDFKNNIGATDIITAPVKSGYFYYQGFIENYFYRKDSAKASVIYFFRKKIFVK